MTERIRRSHNALAEAVRAYLDERQDRRVTLQEMEMEFHTSGTMLKICYKDRFGESLYADTKARKMRSAARMLMESELTVLEVARRFGYDNASKFASAFRSVLGASPTEYRNRETPCPERKSVI